MEPKKTDNPELWCCTRTKFWKAPNPMCQSLRLSEKFACARIRSCPKFCSQYSGLSEISTKLYSAVLYYSSTRQS